MSNLIFGFYFKEPGKNPVAGMVGPYELAKQILIDLTEESPTGTKGYIIDQYNEKYEGFEMCEENDPRLLEQKARNRKRNKGKK